MQSVIAVLISKKLYKEYLFPKSSLLEGDTANQNAKPKKGWKKRKHPSHPL